MLQTRTVEYDSRYAKAIADLWNRSSEVWNGTVFNSSEAKVLLEESSVAYLNLYLVTIGDLVIGYAKLANYSEEKGVAYIELLTVDPQYHGKGIGRQLVQKCVLRAAELGYERIDLFTWAGNTKAVPLYKKCGFFWEKMETQATHLMNFIPGLLNNELLKPYFEYFDWYADNVRLLETKPDGRELNGFDLYDYVWEKDGKRLEISFERRGRGIVSVRTDDFAVNTQVDNAKPVFGLSYPVVYHLENFTDTPVEVSLQGEDDEIIHHNYSHTRMLSGVMDCGADFYITALNKSLTEWERCPSLVTKLRIGNGELTLKTGLKVQYPLSANLRRESNLMVPGREEQMYLNVHNHFPVACQYHVELTQDEHIQFLQSSFDFTLQAGEKSNLPFRIVAKEACIYDAKLKVSAIPENGSKLDFVTDCHDTIYIMGQKAGKNLKDIVYLINSQFYLYFTKAGNGSRNWCGYSSIYGMHFSIAPPQIGLPYTEEFETEDPYEILIEETGSDIQLIVKLRSAKNHELDFALVYRLGCSGQMDICFRVYSLPTSAEDMFAKLKINFPTKGLAFEHKGKIMQIEKDLIDADIGSFPPDLIDGNWLFTGNDDSAGGIIWPRSVKARNDHYRLAWEVNLSEVQRKGISDSEPISLYLDVFKNAAQVRNMADKRISREPLQPSLELVVNEGNPCISGLYGVKLVQHLDDNLVGNFVLETATDNGDHHTTHVTAEEELKSVSWDQLSQPKEALELVSCRAEFHATTVTRRQLVLHSRGEITYSTDACLLTADNDCLQISAATDAKFPGLVSLKYKGDEWLDSAYPAYAPKSFFNPYPGGLGIKAEQINRIALAEETHIVNKVGKVDQFGNLWEGLAIECTITLFEPLKGVSYKQYYLMRPGVPVVIILTEVLGNPGWAQFHRFSLDIFLKHKFGEADGGYLIPQSGEKWQQISACAEQHGLGDYYPQAAMFKQDSEVRLQLFGKGKLSYNMYMDNALIRTSVFYFSEMVASVPSWAAPIYMVLSPELYQAEWLTALITTRFW